jgi:beta-1,4-mannosyl-glycoprotein beta-1,4-N-acetylglucosaminyltransferase
MKKIVHGFTFFNEVDFLEYKLIEIGHVYDYFIIVEGNKTFSGIDKPFIFEENMSRYEKWLPKIIYVKVDDFPETNDAWVRERHQRNAILRGLRSISLSLYDDDIMILGDIDEIPDPFISYHMKTGNVYYPVSVHLRQNLYYYNFNNKSSSDYTTLTYFEFKNLKKDLEKMDLHDAMRQVMDRTDLVFGWHLSFFGGIEQIKRKLKAYSHHDEYPIENYTEEYIRDCMKSQKNIFENLEGFSYLPLKENKYLPPHYELIKTMEE